MLSNGPRTPRHQSRARRKRWRAYGFGTTGAGNVARRLIFSGIARHVVQIFSGLVVAPGFRPGFKAVSGAVSYRTPLGKGNQRLT